MGKRPAPASTADTNTEVIATDAPAAPAGKAPRKASAPKPAAAKPAKKVAAEKVPAAPKAPKPEPAAPIDRGNREDGSMILRRTLGERGHLANEVEKILRQFEGGKLSGVEAPLTVHKVRSMITNSLGENPSTGAVSAVFDRWAAEGYIKMSDKPKSFISFGTKWQAAKGGSLAGFLTSVKENKAKERAKNKAAAKSAA